MRARPATFAFLRVSASAPSLACNQSPVSSYLPASKNGCGYATVWNGFVQNFQFWHLRLGAESDNRSGLF